MTSRCEPLPRDTIFVTSRKWSSTLTFCCLQDSTARPLADFLPTLTIAAKNLATEMTNYNVEQKDLYGETSITREHVQNNVSVRNMLGQRGIRPEELPAAEDIKKVERRVASDDKKIEKTSSKLPSR